MYAPFNFFQASKLAGFEIEVAQAMAAKMGVKLAWQAIGFEALPTGLQRDRWDMVIAAHTITDEHAKLETFANPHCCSGGVAVAKIDAICAGVVGFRRSAAGRPVGPGPGRRRPPAAARSWSLARQAGRSGLKLWARDDPDRCNTLPGAWRLRELRMDGGDQSGSRQWCDAG